VGDGSGSGLANGTNGDQVGSAGSLLDPRLGPLDDHGGPTQTMPLLPGSPARDAGDDGVLAPPFSLTNDQRGLSRQSGSHVDIGAFEADVTPPTSVVGPLPAFSGATFTVNWSGSDGPGGSGIALYYIYVSDNGVTTLWITGTPATSATFTGADGHTYGFYSIALDLDGNYQPSPTGAQASTTVDVAPPTSAVAALPAFSPASFTVSWSGSDGAGSGVASYDVYIYDNGGLPTLWQSGTTATSATFTGADSHAYSFFSLATDEAGNREVTLTANQAYTTVDAVPPTSTVAALPYYSPTSFTVSWSGSDGAGSGVAAYDVYVSEDDTDFTLWQSGTAATSAIFTGADGHYYIFESVATDTVGNRESIYKYDQSFTTVDAAPPTSTVAALPAFSPASFTVSWSGLDGAGSGVASYDVSVSDNGGPFTLWQAGTTATSATFTGADAHTYGFYSVAIDNLGNHQATPAGIQASTRVSAAGPTSRVAPLPTYSHVDFAVSWFGSNAASYDIYVSDNGGPFTQWQLNTTATSATFTGADGHSYGFYSIATDNVGNRQATPTAAQADTRADAAPPTSALNVLPAYSPASFRVGWSGSDGAGSGVASYDVYASDNGGPFTLWKASTTATSATFTGADAHAYGFYSVATDNLGDREPSPTAAQALTRVDAVPPTSAVNVQPAYSPASFRVGWSGSDGAGSGVASYDVYASDNGGPFVLWQFDTTATSATFTGADGHTYGFYCIATDIVGNHQATPTGAQASTQVSAAGPTSQVAPLPAYSRAEFTVSWSGSNAASYGIYVSDNGGPLTLWWFGTTATSTTFTGVDSHTYGFASVATDNLGNREPPPALAQAFTRVDATPPVSAVAGLPTFSPTGLLVHWSGSDSGGSGLRSFDVYVSVDGGAFTPWLVGTTQTSAMFFGSPGHTYGFASVATDNVGNVGPAPTAAQATTTLGEPTRAITARLVIGKVGKKKWLIVEVVFADTGAVKRRFLAPFRQPRFRAIQVGVRDSDGDGLADEVVVTARRGRWTVSRAFPA
jgi:hypothetical protein